MMKISVAYHSEFLEHDAGPDHPEHPDRVRIVYDAIKTADWKDQVDYPDVRNATVEEVSFAHNPKYVEAIRRLSDAGGQYLASMEANIDVKSYDAALRSAGAGLTLVDRIFDSPWKIGFAVNRPPGHHAVWDRPKGFCIFNNIVILTRYIQRKFDIRKIGIIDFDVHHGNGTEAAFWEDENVLFCSLHHDNHFPFGKGKAEDTGCGKGEGLTINIPLAKGGGDDVYLEAFDKLANRRFLEFEPEFLLVSAGFDAHILDVIGGMSLTDNGYIELAKRIKSIADECSQGRVISLFEGGYNEIALRSAVTAYLGELIGE